MIFEGNVWVYGNDVNTDQIFPGKYTYSISEPEEMAAHALEDLDTEFAKQVKPGDIIVAGKNFGCGSSREQAAVCIKAAGVSAVIASSFARIFYRNCINAGLPAIIAPGVSDVVEKGDKIRIDMDKGIIQTPEKQFEFSPLSGDLKEILELGGLINYLKKKGK